MRVNLDDPDNDPRVRALARYLKTSVPHAIGRLFLVWRFCYQRRSPWLLPEDIDFASEIKGFTSHMRAARLVSDQPSPDEPGEPPAARFERLGGGVWVHGVRGRVGYLLASAEGARKSAEVRRAKAAKSRGSPEPPFSGGSTGAQPPHEGWLNGGVPSGSGSGSGYEVSDSGEDLLTQRTPLNVAPDVSPSRASGAGSGSGSRGQQSQRDPRTISNLAAVEADYEAHGKPIPWRDDPRRWEMTHDLVGRPVAPMGPRNE